MTTTPHPRRRFSLRTMGLLKRILPSRMYYRFVGRHEHGSMRIWRQLVTSLPEGRAVLDIGAHRGTYATAVRALRSDSPVHAFEPNPEELDALHAACDGRDIVIEPVAVADRCTTVTFAIDGERSHMIDASDAAASSGATITVEAVSLDEWEPSPDLAVGLMKVDVEGAEDGVFRGGAGLMRRCRPIVLCEVLSDAAGTRVAESLPDGYCYFAINEDRGLRPIDKPTRWSWRHKNILLVPEERRSEINR